jgi:hypothetical protein
MPAVIRVTAESNQAQQSVNVWHWIIPNSSPLTEAQNAVNALGTFYTAIAGVLAVQIFSIGRRVVTVDQVPNLIISPTVSNVTCTGVNRSPLQAAIVLALGSNVVGGSHRGRVYLGPLDGAAIQSDGRSVTASDLTTINTAAAALMATTTGGIQLAVWSRKNRAAQPVTAVGGSPIIGTQRRRLA